MKHVFFFLGLALLGSAGAAQAQTTPLAAPTPGASRVVSGLVRNGRTAVGVPRVRVQVQGDTAINTRTNDEGRFRLLVPNAGQATLEFEKDGYDTQAVALTTAPRSELRIWLERTVVWKSKKGLARDSARRAQKLASPPAARSH